MDVGVLILGIEDVEHWAEYVRQGLNLEAFHDELAGFVDVPLFGTVRDMGLSRRGSRGSDARGGAALPQRGRIRGDLQLLIALSRIDDCAAVTRPDIILPGDELTTRQSNIRVLAHDFREQIEELFAILLSLNVFSSTGTRSSGIAGSNEPGRVTYIIKAFTFLDTPYAHVRALSRMEAGLAVGFSPYVPARFCAPCQSSPRNFVIYLTSIFFQLSNQPHSMQTCVCLPTASSLGGSWGLRLPAPGISAKVSIAERESRDGGSFEGKSLQNKLTVRSARTADSGRPCPCRKVCIKVRGNHRRSSLWVHHIPSKPPGLGGNE